MKFLRVTFLLLILAVLVGNFNDTAFAQEKAGIKVIPASIEEPADPGTIISKTLKVTNESDADKEYYIYKKNIKGVEDGGVPVFSDEMGEKTAQPFFFRVGLRI